MIHAIHWTLLQRRIKHVNELDSMVLKDDFNFSSIVGLKPNIQKQLTDLHPHSLGQISRINGFKTSDLAILIHHYKQRATGWLRVTLILMW